MSTEEFGSLNLDEMVGEASRLGSEGVESNFLDQFVPMPEVKPGATGSVVLRLLPPVKGGKLYQYNRVHTINDRKIHCPRPLVNGKWDRNVECPICDYYSSLWKQIDKLAKAGHVDQADKLKEEARGIKPIERYYYNAIVRVLGDEKNVGPRILSIGKGLHTMIIRAIVGDDTDPDSKLGNITDPKTGYDFIIRKEVTPGEGFPKYDRSGFARQPSPLGTPEEIAKWQSMLHDLTKLRNPKGLEVLEKELAIHRGLIPDEAESFNAQDFDAKWRQKNGVAAKEEVKDLMSYNKTVAVSGGVAMTETPAETKGKVEDAPVENEDFLKELEEMNG